eukprot:2453740-Amphidinium_carterae.1
MSCKWGCDFAQGCEPMMLPDRCQWGLFICAVSEPSQRWMQSGVGNVSIVAAIADPIQEVSCKQTNKRHGKLTQETTFLLTL